MNPGDAVRVVKRMNILPQRDLEVGEVGIIHHVDPRRNDCSVLFLGRLLLWCIPLDVLDVISVEEFKAKVGEK